MSFNILYDKFNNGVAPGGLRDKEQIKVLICYLMDNTDTAISMDFICGVLQKCGAANYFEASEGFGELTANGQLEADGKDAQTYRISESGRFIVKNLADELPASVKDRTLEKYRQALRQRDIKQDNEVKLKTKNSRSYVECTVNDGKNQLLQISMYAPNAEQASVVKNVFYNNTDVIYQAVVALMTGDKKTALNVIATADFNREDFI